MGTIVLLVLFILAVLIVFFVLKSKGRLSGADQALPFFAKKPLTQPERILYFRLVQAMPDHIVLAQVQLSRLLGIKRVSNYRALLNSIIQKSVDFVVCTKDASVVAVIELDDATHAREDRQRADGQKDRALSAAGIRVIRWQAKTMPDVQAIQSELIASTGRASGSIRA